MLARQTPTRKGSQRPGQAASMAAKCPQSIHTQIGLLMPISSHMCLLRPNQCELALWPLRWVYQLGQNTQNHAQTHTQLYLFVIDKCSAQVFCIILSHSLPKGFWTCLCNANNAVRQEDNVQKKANNVLLCTYFELQKSLYFSHCTLV